MLATTAFVYLQSSSSVGLFGDDRFCLSMTYICLISGVIMSRQPLGKTLLRNVIRHTDAHNKVRLSSCVCVMSGKHAP